jgi:hypothetical protein
MKDKSKNYDLHCLDFINSVDPGQGSVAGYAPKKSGGPKMTGGPASA